MAYGKNFKEETVRLSNEIGVKKAPEQLGVPYYTLTGWRWNERQYSTLGATFQSGRMGRSTSGISMPTVSKNVKKSWRR